MRILMLAWDFPPQVSGGTAAHVVGLADSLAQAGHDVIVLTIDDPRADRAADLAGPVPVLRTPHDVPWIPPDRMLAQTASTGHGLVQLSREVERRFDGWRPDVVHGHDWRVGWPADTLAELYDVPFVLTMHGTERVRHGGNLPPGQATDISAIEWWLAFRAHRLISPTRFIVDQLVDNFEISPDRIIRIPNGIDPALWGGVDPDATPPDREPLVVSWGRVQFEKGFQVLAAAMASVRSRVDGSSCVIAGRGSYLPELQTRIDVEGVSDVVELPGFLRADELRRLLQRAGCVVIPSLYEPFGIVALEALAAGAPLIVARTGGLAELVSDTDAGLTFEPGNPDDLAHCIELVLTDRLMREQLSTAAHTLVRDQYAWESIAERTAEVYSDTIERFRPRS
ncbi:MAG: glycosyltransferase family 4 protein [Actinomycetota bacterium]